MEKSKLFIASCISIGTAAMVFAIRGDTAGPMSAAFHITNEQMGLVFSPAFFAHWIDAKPTPPDAPCIRTVSPAFAFAF